MKSREIWVRFCKSRLLERYLLRSKLIEQWYSIGQEYVVDPGAVTRKVHHAETLITNLLGKNFLPSFPVFILTFLQASETRNKLQSDVGSYGGLYELLISQALVSKWNPDDLDLVKTYLSELAYWMFTNQKRRISEDDWMHFHNDYCTKFKIKPSREKIKRGVAGAGLFNELDGIFCFRHLYCYYYFVARYFRDNISKQGVKNKLITLCAELYKEENANIWLFLTHLSKDPFIIDTILSHAKSVFGNLHPAKFEGDVSFLADLAKSVEKIKLEDKKFTEAKEERLRKLDENPNRSHLTIEVPAQETADSGKVVVEFFAQITVALRTLDVLGQLVKNFPGSLEGSTKFALVKECYEIGLRTITMLFDFFRDNSEGFIEVVTEMVRQEQPELKDPANREAFKKRLKGFLFWLVEANCFGLIKRISHAAGHSQLTETYAEVLADIDSKGAALIDLSIRLDDVGVPEDMIEKLNGQFKDNVFCDRLLRQLVVQHFYLFPTRETVKQKICSMLDIPILNLRGLDVIAKQEKLSRPKR